MFLKGLWFSLLVINLTASCVFAAAKQTINIGETPNWVIKRPVELPETLPLDEIDGGVYNILVDNQIRVYDKREPEYFSRYAELVTNQQGLKKISQINVDYDPIYQTLVFNSLVIRRKGQIIDKLKTAKNSVIQRETELEKLLYHGRLTANIILDDVRTGDIVEYSYTIKGRNPVYNNIFSYSRYLEWSIPVHHQSVRVLWGKKTPLHITILNSKLKAKQHQFENYKEYSISANDSPTLSLSSESPDWYDPYAAVFFSETKHWSDVVKWALPLYQKSIESGPELGKIASSIRKQNPDPSQQIVQALEFVQSEVRYLGIEMGKNSHTPSPANETLQRRYGDCKDKAVLLVSLLDMLGIESSPALVHTENTRLLAEYPASVNAFDHVLVKVKHNNEAYWLDPTRQYQRGNLSEIYQPDYRYALVIKESTTELEKMNQTPASSDIIIHEKFDLSKGGGKEVIYQGKTEYIGYSADRMRYRLADEGLAARQKKYLDYYRSLYTEVEPIEKSKITEDKNGHMYLTEKYLLTKFWDKDEKEKQFDASFYADSIRSYLSKPKQLTRNSPYSISHPVNITQNISVNFKQGDWGFTNDELVVDNRFFYYKHSVSFDNNTDILKLSYQFKSRTDHVVPGDLDEYMTARNKARDTIEYAIEEYFDSDTPNSNDNPDSQTSVTDEDVTFDDLILLTIIFLVLSGLLFSLVNWRLEARIHPIFVDEYFYPTSLVKLYLLTVITLGLYPIYWFYRNWKYVKEKESSSIMPIARGIFNIFWYYPFYNKLAKDSVNRYQKNILIWKPLAVLLAVVYFASAFVDDYLLVMMLIIPLALLPLANYINHINSNNLEAFSYNSRWLPRHTVLLLALSPSILFVSAGELNLVPSDKVVDGSNVWSHDIKFMHRKGVFPAGEKIVLFYSDGIFSVREDGNGFTENNVFSYWRDDETGFNVETENLSKVKKIDVSYSNASDDNTVVTLVREDDSDFVLYVSTEDGLDMKFVQQLKDRWIKSRK